MQAALRSISSLLVIAACGVALLGTSPSAAQTTAAPAPTSQFQFKDTSDASLGLWDGDKPVLVYNHGDIPFRQGRRERSRSSYVHPIYGLDGEVLTDDYPRDHYHHHGLFWCWPHVKVGDRQLDFWEQDDIDINFKRWLTKETDGNTAQLAVENGWFVGDEEIMTEEVHLTVHPESSNGRAIDVTLKWTPTKEPVSLAGAEGKSYGGLSLRFGPRKKTVITVPGGRASEDLLITRLPWADLSGQFKGATGTSGAVLFVHPTHDDFPPEWMTRDYGLLAVGWPGVNEKTFAVGKPVTCRYRVWVHRGAPTADEIQQQFDAFKATK